MHRLRSIIGASLCASGASSRSSRSSQRWQRLLLQPTAASSSISMALSSSSSASQGGQRLQQQQQRRRRRQPAAALPSAGRGLATGGVAVAAAAAAAALMLARPSSSSPSSWAAAGPRLALAFQPAPPVPLHATHGRGTRAAAYVARRALWSSLGPGGAGGDGDALPSGPAAPCTVPGCLEWATKLFAEGGVPDAELSAEYLLLHALGAPASTPRAAFRAAPLRGAAVDDEALARFRGLCRRRWLRREPVQYLVGAWDFHRIALEVAPPVLIPRPETEELVEWVLEEAKAARRGPLRLLDVGCGTGAIGLALLKSLLPHSGSGSSGSSGGGAVAIEAVGLDPNPAAVELSRRNAELVLGPEAARQSYRVVQGRIGSLGSTARAEEDEETRRTIEALGPGSFDFIVSNPPYIPQRDMAGLQEEVKAWEDEGALLGGGDGADIIRAILQVAPRLLRPPQAGGLGKVWMEVDVSHPALFEREEKEQGAGGPMRLVEWRHDLAGRPRFICWGLPPQEEQA